MSTGLHLEFPSDASVGFVGQIDPRGVYQPIGPARGRVAVPAGARLVLHLAPQWLRVIAPLPPDALHSVDLSSTKVEDEDLALLAPFKKLRELDLSKADRIGDAGVAHLARLTGLRELDLYRTRITDAGLVALAGLVSLEHLHLGATGVRGHGIIHLRHLPRLRELNLHNTAVDDVDVQDAAEIASLRQLVVFNTPVTIHGAAALLRRRPDLSVYGARTPELIPTPAFLARFIHRLAPADPITESSSAEEVSAAFNRAVGRGTEISVGPKRDDRVVMPAMDPDLIGAVTLELLLRLGRGALVRVRFPDGREREVSWLVDRGPDRRRTTWAFEISENLWPRGRRLAQRRRATGIPAP